MENITDLISKWSYGRVISPNVRAVGVVGNPTLGAGVLLGYTLLGVATYIWAFWCQRGGLSLLKRSWLMPYSCQQTGLRGVQNIHGPLISVISMDVVNVITAIILGSAMAASACNSANICFYTFLLCFISRWFGVIFHLLTAHFSISYLCLPQWGNKLRCTFALIYLLIFIMIPVYVLFNHVAIYMMAFFIFVLVLSTIAKFRAPSASSSHTAEKMLIMIFAMSTLLVVYLPSFVLECLISTKYNWEPTDEYDIIYVNVLFFTNCHLIINGLLCFVILKMSAAEEEEHQVQVQQQHQEWQQQQHQQWQQQQQH